MFVAKLKEDLEEKGKEINRFRGQHSIKFQNEASSGKKDANSKDSEQTQGILVS